MDIFNDGPSEFKIPNSLFKVYIEDYFSNTNICDITVFKGKTVYLFEYGRHTFANTSLNDIVNFAYEYSTGRIIMNPRYGRVPDTDTLIETTIGRDCDTSYISGDLVDLNDLPNCVVELWDEIMEIMKMYRVERMLD